jgi:hypothetical protein
MSAGATLTGHESRAELEAALAELLAEIQLIDAQLSDRNRLTADGKRLSGIEYHQWRAKAVRARALKTHQYRGLKAKLRNLPPPKPERPPLPDPEGDLGALLALLRFTRGLGKSGRALLTPEDWAFLDGLSTYLRERGVEAA